MLTVFIEFGPEEVISLASQHLEHGSSVSPLLSWEPVGEILLQQETT